MAWDFIKENGKVLALNKPSTIEIFCKLLKNKYPIKPVPTAPALLKALQ
jgi:hypothetical protein